MRVVVQNTLSNRQWIGYDGPGGFVIGRDASCEVRLDSRFVSGVHARVEKGPGGWELELLPGVNPIEVDGKECKPDGKVPLKRTSVLRVMEFVLTLEDVQHAPEAGEKEDQLTELQNVLHANVLRRLDLRLDGRRRRRVLGGPVGAAQQGRGRSAAD